jgi:hypothetical protein
MPAPRAALAVEAQACIDERGGVALVRVESSTPRTSATTARCRTVGKLLADRALSRLMKQDWPRTIEEMENRRRGS